MTFAKNRKKKREKACYNRQSSVKKWYYCYQRISQWIMKESMMIEGKGDNNTRGIRSMHTKTVAL